MKGASIDPDQIAKWFDRWPDANIGIRTGQISGIFVLDVDGEKGRESLAALQNRYGQLPQTLSARSGSGGLHAVYLYPKGATIRNSASKIAPGLDVRGEGGYFVAAPSNHVSGGQYEWLNDLELAQAPGWLLELIAKSSAESKLVARPGEPIPEGQRNDTLFRIGCGLRTHGATEDEILDQLRITNEARCQSPLSDEELEQITASVSRYAPGKNRPHLTDLGNAQQLIEAHGQDLRYVGEWGRWLVWNGTRWVPDRTGEIYRRAKDTVRLMYLEAGLIEDEGERKKLAVWAKQSESKTRIGHMIDLAQSEPGIAITPDVLDADPWLFNCQNGTVDLRTGQLRPHDRADLITKLIPVDYDPDATAPTFEAFLNRVMDGNEALIGFLRRAVGYSLTGDVSEQKLFFTYGSGANGKSTLINAILDALGDYGKQAAPDLLVVKRGGHPTDVADVKGARFVASVEVDEGKRLAESLVKQMTGGDRIKARFMRQDFFEFEPTHKIWLSANHKPVIRGTDHAIWRRILLIPFEVQIPESEQDKKLPEKLRAELPGILAWAVRGCLEWQQWGLSVPVEVQMATDDYREDMDPLAEFFEDECLFDTDEWISRRDLWDRYEGWAFRNHQNRLSSQAFNEALRSRGIRESKPRIDGRRVKGWAGVGLKDKDNALVHQFGVA